MQMDERLSEWCDNCLSINDEARRELHAIVTDMLAEAEADSYSEGYDAGYSEGYDAGRSDASEGD